MGRELFPGDFLEDFFVGGGGQRDLRIDRWSTCVWPGGYAQATSRSFISTLFWDYCQRWTERVRRNSGWCFLIFMVVDAQSIRERHWSFEHLPEPLSAFETFRKSCLPRCYRASTVIGSKIIIKKKRCNHDVREREETSG